MNQPDWELHTTSRAAADGACPTGGIARLEGFWTQAESTPGSQAATTLAETAARLALSSDPHAPFHIQAQSERGSEPSARGPGEREHSPPASGGAEVSSGAWRPAE